MNVFAGNITIKGNRKIPDNFKFDYLESLSKSGDKNIFVFGKTKINSLKELLEFFKKNFQEIKNYDLSISSKDKIELLPYDYEEGIYELVSFEGEQVDFQEIKNRFIGNDAIFSIREAEISQKFGNKIIKVDFVY